MTIKNIAAILLLLFVTILIPVNSKVIYVPDNYSTIQMAINLAESGDKIVVRDGIYVENIRIIKNNLTLISENGSENCIIQAANPFKAAIRVFTNNVTIIGFTIREASHYCAGITLDNSTHSYIANNKLIQNDYGLLLYNSSDNLLLNNTFVDNWHGISLQRNSTKNIIKRNNVLASVFNSIELIKSNYNSIINNYVDSNKNGSGIHITRSIGNTVVDNMITKNKYGILLKKSKNNVLKNNIVIDNYYGIVAIKSNDNLISENIAKNNFYYGIYIQKSENNTITANDVSLTAWNGLGLWGSKNNLVSNNTVYLNANNGIYLFLSDKNNITGNRAYSNSWGGIYTWFSKDNKILKNSIYLNNWTGIGLFKSGYNKVVGNNISENYIGIQIYDSRNNKLFLNSIVNNTYECKISKNSANIWNSTKPISYVYNGTTYKNNLGNYWSDYSGSDLNKDGIGDSPYIIDKFNVDFYPIISKKVIVCEEGIS